MILGLSNSNNNNKDNNQPHLLSRLEKLQKSQTQIQQQIPLNNPPISIIKPNEELKENNIMLTETNEQSSPQQYTDNNINTFRFSKYGHIFEDHIPQKHLINNVKRKKIKKSSSK